MTSRQANQQEDNYFRVLRILNEKPDTTQRELATKLGVSVSGINYCLKALVEKGLVKMYNFTDSNNKLGYVYMLTPAGVTEKVALTAKFLKRKMHEYECLKKEIKVVQQEIKLFDKPDNFKII